MVPADAIPVAVANSRLAAILGLTLLILFALQVVTVLAGVRSVLTWHVVLGLILLPPVGLQLTSVTWRMVSYHRGRDGFADITPPPPVLRVLGLFLAGLTVTLLVSGITLLDGPGWAQSPALLVHQVSFNAWLAAVVVHVVPHFLQAVHLASRDWARRVGGARRAARGGSARCGRRGEPAAGRCSPPVHPTTCSTFPSHELQVRPATTARPAGPPAGRASRESSVDSQQAGSGIVEQCGC